jgi:hypothetical protein
MIKKLATVAVLLALAACGGGDSPSTPTPVPTPTPVSFSGTYTGALSYTSSGTGVLTAQGTLRTTHSGNALTFGDLSMSLFGQTITYGMGDAVLNQSDRSFDNLTTYQSTGCGTVVSRYHGYFSGDGGILNLTYKLVSSCGTADIRGELRR